MSATVRLLIGTRKGLFLLDGDPARQAWSLSGPHCEAWPINHAVADPGDGTIYAAGGNEWFGAAVWKSADGGKTWSHSSQGLAYPEGEEPVKNAWSLGFADGRLLAGVQPAGLFASDDGGATWEELAALRTHPSHEFWQPGGAGLILHGILASPADPAAIWVAISAAGVFHSADGGKSWEPRNRGTRQDFAPEEHRYAEVGQCVHAVTMAAGAPERLYQQNHCGMYRSDDGGRNWQSIEAGLPSSFGFPAVAHPHDPETLYLFPLNGDIAGRYAPDAKAAVWRTRDGGKSWQALRQGLPQEGAYVTVLRRAMAVDKERPAGVYFGTTSGSVFASADEGESWTEIARHLPSVSSLEVG